MRTIAALAFCESFDLFRQLFDLLGFLDNGEGENGSCVCFLDLLFKFGNHFIELGDVLFELLLVGPLDCL